MTGGLFVRLVSFGRDEIDRKGRTHEPQCQRRREKDQFVTKGGRTGGGGGGILACLGRRLHDIADDAKFWRKTC